MSDTDLDGTFRERADNIAMGMRSVEGTDPRPMSDQTGKNDGLRKGHVPLRRVVAHIVTIAVLTAACAPPATADEVGEIGVDWAGNDIVIEAINDPDVSGVTCHLAYFKRGLIDRLANGNWFEDPSNSAIECQQTGPITLGKIDRSESGDDVFRTSRSVIFKSLRVKRIFDEANRTLIYVAHARELTRGSAKVSISTVPVRDTVTP